MKNQIDYAEGMLQVSVPGNLLSTNADQFRMDVLSALNAQSPENSSWLGVDIDLTRAQMVDSAGLNAIISVIRRLKGHGRRALIRVKDKHVHRVCLFTRLDRQADIVLV